MRRRSVAQDIKTSRSRELRMKLLTTLAAAAAVSCTLTLAPQAANAQGYYWVGGYAVPAQVYGTYAAYRPVRYRAYRPRVYVAAPYYYPASYAYAYYPAYSYPVAYGYASCGWGWC
jgi:hypothetical protein